MADPHRATQVPIGMIAGDMATCDEPREQIRAAPSTLERLDEDLQTFIDRMNSTGSASA